VERTARPPSLFREELRRAWRELRGVQPSPLRTACAVALGLFVGSIPAFGLHTPVVLTVCLLLQLDAVLAWVASNISNPFFAPFLITAEVQVGARLLDGKFLYISPDLVREMGFWSFVWSFIGYAFAGAPIVGLALAVLGGAIVYVVLKIKRRYRPPKPLPPYRLPENAPPWWHAVERVAGRYVPMTELSTPAQRSRFHYVRVKLMTDPMPKMIADLFGDRPGVLGELLDVGTGRGQLPLLLLELGRATKAHAVDWDEQKVLAARDAAAHAPALDASFDVGDVRGAALAPADTVLLLDVLHYMAPAEQDEVLRHAARAVRAGGRLIVREADTERGWRSWVTLGEELFFTLVRFNRGARVRFRAAREIVALLEAEGMACAVRPAWGKTPFSNVLIVAERPAAAAC
jgi:uncharacterized protein (DUF2062 family)/2-polyprenyl-3-methyl-5-hydroxy-6-metoxy-1,4-benzoquinol methylase